MLYSVVIPIYGDSYLAEKCVERLYKTLTPIVRENLPGEPIEKAFEIILVIDGLQNDLNALKDISAKWPAVKIIYLSRNFGQHNAISAGFEHAAGQYILRLNVDCQDPPEEIPKLIQGMESQNADQVIGVYQTKANSWLNRLGSNAFYSFFNWLSGYHTPLNTSPLRIMTRRYQEMYNNLPEKSRFPQGLDEYLGFKKIYVTIRHEEREDKKSSYNFSRRMHMAITAAVAFSDRPMYIIIKLGLLVLVGGICFFLYNLFNYFYIGAPISGYTSLMSLLIISSSLLYMAIGVLGLYIGDVQREVKSRPYYLIKSKINFKTQEL